MTTHKTALEVGGSDYYVLAEGILNFKSKRPSKNFLTSQGYWSECSSCPDCRGPLECHAEELDYMFII